MTAGLAQTFQAIRQVRAFGQEKFEEKRAKKTLMDVRQLNIKNTRTSNFPTPANDVLVGIILFGVIAYGGFQVASGSASAGISCPLSRRFNGEEPMKNWQN